MTEDQRKLFAELQKELNKVFEKHIEDLKKMKVSTEIGAEDVRKDTNF